jgi:tetratricopeptide (TPR) repeat protein
MDVTPRIEELKRRVLLDPASIAFAALAEEYRRAGQFEEANATCVLGLRRQPAKLSAHVTLGRALAAAGRPEEARAEFEHVLAVAPENLAAIRGLADMARCTESVCADGDGPAERAAEAARCVPAATSRAGRPLALDSSMPHHTVSAAPAIMGLQDFLGAISRARTGVSGGLSAGAR